MVCNLRNFGRPRSASGRGYNAMVREAPIRRGGSIGETHDHDAVVHEHRHIHVTHYHRPGEDVTHLVAEHDHEHNHPALSHQHEPHEDPDKEHLREAHVHDHARPETSPG
jgi:hypothetical protein